MAIEFKLPEVSEGVDSVDVAEILVAEGDVIEAGAIICEVETDKAVAEIECPHAGTITKILISEGDSVPVGQPLVVIEESGGSAPVAAEAPVAESAAPEPPAAAQPAPAASVPLSGEPETIDFKLPEVSEGVDSVDVAEVLVAAGDTIEADAVVCEVETDKAVAEINCPHAGTVRAVHVSAGDSIGVGAPLITIETVVGAPAAAVAPAATPTPAAASPSVAPAAAPATAPASTKPAATASVTSSNGRPPAPAGPPHADLPASWGSISIR